MAIFDREWCDLYSWTVNGGRIYRVGAAFALPVHAFTDVGVHSFWVAMASEERILVLLQVKRDREYWRLMHRMLAEFWWQHVVPAKHALRQGEGCNI
jgi:hypothetical protein